MQRLFSFVIVFAIACVSFQSLAQVQKYDEKTRDKLLFLKNNPPPVRIVLKGEFKSEQEKLFVEFYLQKIVPQDEKSRAMFFQAVALKLLMDSGSQNSDVEMKAWEKEYLHVSSQFNELAVNEQWTATLKLWAKLAEGLSGQLADDARRQWRERELSVFPVEMKATMDQIDTFQLEHDNATNAAESANKLSEVYPELVAAGLEFREGKISFEAATARINAAYQKGGYHFVGHEAAQAAGESLNKMAILRTKLAQSKGKKTWSEYVLTITGDGYTEKYRGLEKQRDLLVQVIAMVRPVLQQMYTNRMQVLGLKPEQLRNQYLGLLRPKGLQQLTPYFPADKITQTWEETMIESGFSPEVLSQILVDDSVTREKKNKTIAYLMPWFGPYTEVEELDLATLKFDEEPLHSDKWRKGLVYILQSYKVGGLSEYGTAFHEGGHALEKVTKMKTIATDEAYGYVETPSMTMERFLKDPEFIFQKAFEADGKKPTREEIAEMLSGEKMLDVVQFMHLMTSSLFDLDLWNYDYTKPKAQTFLERVKFLEEKIEKYAGSDYGNVPSPVPFYYSQVATSHFTSGDVRNIGYLFAEAASTLMANFLSDSLEKETGRRTWYQQPGLAKILVDKFYSQGWKTTFPENIEGITGRNYDPVSIIAQSLQEALDCQTRLEAQK